MGVSRAERMGSSSHKWMLGAAAGTAALLGAAYLFSKELRRWRCLEQCMQQVGVACNGPRMGVSIEKSYEADPCAAY
jgi:hypothetical protein